MLEVRYFLKDFRWSENCLGREWQFGGGLGVPPRPELPGAVFFITLFVFRCIVLERCLMSARQSLRTGRHVKSECVQCTGLLRLVLLSTARLGPTQPCPASESEIVASIWDDNDRVCL